MEMLSCQVGKGKRKFRDLMREFGFLHGEFHFIFSAISFTHRAGVDCGVGLVENFSMTWLGILRIKFCNPLNTSKYEAMGCLMNLLGTTLW